MYKKVRYILKSRIELRLFSLDNAGYRISHMTAPTPSKESSNVHQTFLHPKYWGTWCFIGTLRLLTLLPYSTQIAIGKCLGRLAYKFASRRRHIAETNIRLCFPEFSEAEQKKIVKETFEAQGISIFETAIAWWKNPKDFKHMAGVEGLEHVHNAINNGQGVIFLGGHFTSLDICGFLMSLYLKVDVTYRPHNNALLDSIMIQQRKRLYGNSYTRKDIRGFLKSLKNTRILWYAPDQDLGRKNSVFAPFFHNEAATITATSRLAKASNAQVIPLYCYRKQDNSGYLMKVFPPLQNYPSGDDVTDATMMNAWLETAIREAPSQYMWLHRRFKTRPDGETKIY